MKNEKIIISDVDGVIAGKQFFCDKDRKFAKIFGCGDSEGLKLLKEDGWDIIFVTADVEAYPITEARLDHLDCPCIITNSDEERISIVKTLASEYKCSIFIGDSLSDIPCASLTTYSIAPSDARPEIKHAVNWVTKSHSAGGVFCDVYQLTRFYISKNKQYELNGGSIKEFLSNEH